MLKEKRIENNCKSTENTVISRFEVLYIINIFVVLFIEPGNSE